MASIPRKSVKGANLKKWLVETIDAILDYLHTSRIRPGYGIAVEETPSGTIVRLAGTPSSNAPVATGGGGSVVATGFPNYSNLIANVAINTAYSYAFPVWVFGAIQVTDSEGLNIEIGGTTYPLFEFMPTFISQATYKTVVCIPIPTGTSFSFTQTGGSVYSNLHIFGCT